MDRLGDFLLGPNDTKFNGIYCGDALELSKCLPDDSIDLIFTDPPYSKKFLPLYRGIFEVSRRVLKRNGFLLIYVGGHWKDTVMANARLSLDYFWDYVVWEPGNSPVNWQRRTLCRHKSILAYTRPDSDGLALPRYNILSVWLGGGEDKKFHVWGQDESQARYFIDGFSRPYDVVLDFCAGGGTTPAMAKALGRRFLAFDIDADLCNVARDRVSNMPIPPVKNPASDHQIALPLDSY